MPELVIGSVPRGEDYYNQRHLIADLWRRLERDNVLLVAPRRFGKTAAMYRLLDSPEERYHPLYTNVEDIGSAGDFMVGLLALFLRDQHLSRLMRTVYEGVGKMTDWLRSLPSSIDVGGVKVEIREKTDVNTNWREHGDRIMDYVSRETPRLLLLIDEFPIMMSAMAETSRDEAVQFLRWFRRIRTAPETNARFVLGGSTNLISSLDDLGLVDTVNDLAQIRLRPFDLQTAAGFVETMFETRNVPLSTSACERILELVGAPIPYLLAVFLESIFERAQVRGGTVTPELVDAAFSEDLLGGGTALVFRHYWSRLRQYYSDEEATAARALLNLMSRAAAGVQFDTLFHAYLRVLNREGSQDSHDAFARLLQKLDNDFYITQQDGECAFLSRVLKLWWQRHYGYREG